MRDQRNQASSFFSNQVKLLSKARPQSAKALKKYQLKAKSKSKGVPKVVNSDEYMNFLINNYVSQSENQVSQKTDLEVKESALKSPKYRNSQLSNADITSQLPESKYDYRDGQPALSKLDLAKRQQIDDEIMAQSV